MSSKLILWNAVLTTLQNAQASGQPLNGIIAANSIFDGIYPSLHDLPPNSFPAIVLEPDKDDEEWFTTGVPPAIRSKFSLFVSILVREAKFNKGISGDSSLNPRVYGLLELTDLIKNVLQKDQSLGAASTAGQQKLSFPNTTFFFEGYPIREAKIRVLLESQLTTTSH